MGSIKKRIESYLTRKTRCGGVFIVGLSLIPLSELYKITPYESQVRTKLIFQNEIKERTLPITCSAIDFYKQIGEHFFPGNTWWILEKRMNYIAVIISNVRLDQPVLVTIASNWTLVDSEVLFDRRVYRGVDSNYIPWFRMNGTTFEWGDTSRYCSDIIFRPSKDKKILFGEMSCFIVIESKEFRISSSGRIKLVADSKIVFEDE